MDFPEGYEAFLERHRDLIVERASEAKSKTKILHKFLWLAHYHNDVCSTLKYIDQSSLTISSGHFPWLEEFPETSNSIMDDDDD
jgi:hypothetical protein